MDIPDQHRRKLVCEKHEMKQKDKSGFGKSKRQSHKCVEEVREPFVSQGCLKSLWSPQITLHPCFYFSPSCNKSAQTWGFFYFCPCRSLSCFSPNTGIPQALPGLCAVWASSPGMGMLLSSAASQCKTFPGPGYLQDLCSQLGTSQHVPLHCHLLHHLSFCYPTALSHLLWHCGQHCPLVTSPLSPTW